ncbi:MAG: hypothetical protein LIO85_09290 [Rikenellaceae bacterium]|nr:hypothetical protein [Rikenellaceae bacterium]
MKKFLLSISVTLSLLACNNTPAEDERQIHRDLLEDFTCPIFRAWVLEIFDSNKDGEIWENELIHYGNIMDISDLGITSLEGIEHFKDYELVYAQSNKIKSVENIKFHETVKGIYLDDNEIERLGISNLRHMELLGCSGNPLVELDLSGENCLSTLHMGNNPELKWVDFSHCQNLYNLTVFNSKFTELDLLNCPNLTHLFIRDNELLETLYIPKSTYNNLQINYYGLKVRFSYPKDEPLNDKFTSPRFLAYLLENFDTDKDGVITDTELLDVSAIHISGMGIKDLELKYLPLLGHIYASNNDLKEVDLTENVAVTTVDFSYNDLENIRFNPGIRSADISYNTLECIDLDGCSIQILNCRNNRLETLSVDKSPKIYEIDVRNNRLTELDINRTGLSKLYCDNNLIGRLDCSTNELIEITFAGNPITELYCSNNPLKIIDLTNTDNPVTTLEIADFRNCRELEYVNLTMSNEATNSKTSRSNIILTECPALREAYIYNYWGPYLTISSSTSLENLEVGYVNTTEPLVLNVWPGFDIDDYPQFEIPEDTVFR